MRSLTTKLLGVSMAMAAVLLLWAVALADAPTAPGTGTPHTTLPAAGKAYSLTVGAAAPIQVAYANASHTFYDVAEIKYSLNATRLQSCALCHTVDAVNGVNGMNSYGTAVLNAMTTTLGIAAGVASYGDGKVLDNSGLLAIVPAPAPPKAPTYFIPADKIATALGSIESADSDVDTQSNKNELWALTGPGDVADLFEQVPSIATLATVHGDYGETPDQCARCHRTHTAQAPILLVQQQSVLCLSCHDGAGATTNVKDGVIGSNPLRGGGFVNAKMNTNPAQAALATGPVTSNHVYDGTAAKMWGWGANGSGFGKATVTLECGNCHDPHVPTWTPNEGTTKYTQYRMLQGSPRESGVGEERQGRGFYLSIPDEVPPNTLGLDGRNYVQSYFAMGTQTRPDTGYQPSDRIQEFCGLCHTRYIAGTLVANTNESHGNTAGSTARAGDSTFMYQHATKEASCSTGSCHAGGVTGSVVNGSTVVMPPDHPTGTALAFSRPRCLDCHSAHGTNAAMTGMAAGEATFVSGGVTFRPNEYPDGSYLTGSAASKLLRINNRGVCTLCHEK